MPIPGLSSCRVAPGRGRCDRAAGRGEPVRAVPRPRDPSPPSGRRALERSQVMDLVGWLSDVYGPRVTGTPAIEEAREWAADRLRAWGRGERPRGALRVRPRVVPRPVPCPHGRAAGDADHRPPARVEPEHGRHGRGRRWCASTSAGAPTSNRYRGTLRGKIVLPQPARAVPLLDGRRRAAHGRGVAGGCRPTGFGVRWPSRRGGAPAARRSASGPRPSTWTRAWSPSSSGGSTAVIVSGAPSGSDLDWPTQTHRRRHGVPRPGRLARPRARRASCPSATIAVEHYNRMVRILERGLPVRVELRIATRFHDEDARPNGFNLLGEIPGTDRADEVVLLGAHLDGTPGATRRHRQRGRRGRDDGGRCASCGRSGAAPPAHRSPYRAVGAGRSRGSSARAPTCAPTTATAATMRGAACRLTRRLSAYYNLDNGAGRIRGIWAAGEPPHRADLRGVARGARGPRGNDESGVGSTRGTESRPPSTIWACRPFSSCRTAWSTNSRTHHSNMDFYDPRARRRRHADGGRRGRVRLQHGDARRAAATQGGSLV